MKNAAGTARHGSVAGRRPPRVAASVCPAIPWVPPAGDVA